MTKAKQSPMPRMAWEGGKNLTFAAVAIGSATLLLTSCFSPLEPTALEEKPAETKLFTFHPKGDFSTAYEEMTRAAVRLEESNVAGVTDLWVLDYVDGACVQSVHQTPNDDSFGTVAMTLTYGHHDIKFVASKGASPNVTDEGISWAKVLDTFCLDYPVEVTASSNGNRAPELKRCISGVTLENTDAVPENAKEIQVTVSKRYGTLTLPSLVGGGEAEYTNTFTMRAGDAGQTGIQFTTYTLCPTDEFTTDVSIKVVGKDDSTISEFTLTDVALKQNRRTVLKGECFAGQTAAVAMGVAVDYAWLDDEITEF